MVALRGSDNSGERKLLEHLLIGLRELLSDGEQAKWTDAAIRQAIELRAPLGIKKKVLTVDVASNRVLLPTGLPGLRCVQEADEAELLDEIGEHLRAAGWKGEILGQRRIEVLNASVEFCFQRLVEVVSSLAPTNLLEFLVAHHERLTREQAMYRLTLFTRLACFGDRNALLAQFSKERESYIKTAVAARFVVEYVTARQPGGSRNISLTVYDRLLALASRIFDLGSTSDLVHLELADPKMSILGSGRLGFSVDKFQEARSAFISVLSVNELGRASDDFTKHWADPSLNSVGSSSSLIAEIEAASEGEFGAPLRDLVAFMAAASALGFHSTEPFICLREDSLIREVADGLGWLASRATQALGALRLEARAEFLSPKTPFSPEDVYPWRFNRELSYLRRPFLVRDDQAGCQIIYGVRHVEVASDNLINLVFGGRLRARTLRMRQLMGEIASTAGEAFNTRVARCFEGKNGLVVRRKFQKASGLRLPGDIDVLVAAPTSHVLLLIECKDLAVCRTPREFKNHIEDLFNESSGFLRKHLAREHWVRNHLVEVVRCLQLRR